MGCRVERIQQRSAVKALIAVSAIVLSVTLPVVVGAHSTPLYTVIGTTLIVLSL